MTQLLGPTFGNGQDGDGVISSNSDLNSTKISCSGSANSTTLTVASTTGFLVGDLILIHKSRGNTTTTCGTWELNRIASIGSGQFTLGKPLTNSYQDSGADQSQCVLVPEYRSLIINNGVTVSPAAWDGDVGGITAIFCSGKLTINGIINANEKGHRGGQVSTGCRSGEGTLGGRNTQTNPYGTAAGGGGSVNAGGSGGGNGTAGEDKAYTPGSTGGSSDLISMVFGGGGATSGASEQNPGANGGSGGGIILIYAKSIVLNGNIFSNGQNGGNSTQGDYSRGGGGGAGGSIIIKTLDSFNVGTNLITATGGSGGIATGGTNGNINGGAGGSGRIRIESCKSISGSTNPSASQVIGGHKWCGGLAAVI